MKYQYQIQCGGYFHGDEDGHGKVISNHCTESGALRALKRLSRENNCLCGDCYQLLADGKLVEVESDYDGNFSII